MVYEAKQRVVLKTTGGVQRFVKQNNKSKKETPKCPKYKFAK